jgi:DNA-directed RNA polymerase sigma subunit (sigma70/sigma32)
MTMRAKRLTENQRQEIFRVLVSTQDLGLMSVPESRQHVSKQFEITEDQVRQIEDEGLDKEWPPLNEAMQEVG